MNKKRVRLIKITIISFWILLAVSLTAVLIITGVVHFNWSDNIIQNYKYEQNKNKDKRILVIGDSQLEKWPIPHSLNNDLENFCIDNNIGLLNASHHGFGPIEYLNLIKKHSPDFKPQLIMIFYYTGNDLTDVMYRSNKEPAAPTHEVWRVAPGEKKNNVDSIVKHQENQKPYYIPDQEKLNILRQSEFNWDLFKEKGVDTTLIRYAQNRILSPNMIGPEYVNPHVLVMGTWQPNYLFDNNAINSPASRNTWRTIARIFEEIVDYAAFIGSKVCIITIPSTVQVDTSHYDFYRKATYNVSEELLTYDMPQQLLGEFSQAGNIPYLNLLPYFKNVQNTSVLYFENDDHLNSEGHFLAYKLVKEKLLLPFIKDEIPRPDTKGIDNYYKKHNEWAVSYTEQSIRSDQNWMQSVQKKAEEQNLPIDSMIKMDARYLMENEK